MATEQFVKLPADVVAGSQKFDTINLIGIVIRRFALPGTTTGNAIERDLESKFASAATIGLSDAIAAFDQTAIKYRQLTNGDTELLRQQLQTGNDASALQLIEISNASKLLEWTNIAEQAAFTRLWPRSEGCLVLRYDYDPIQSNAYYLASLPGYSKRPITLSWPSLVDAGIGSAVEIPAPTKMIDAQALAEHLHLMEQAKTAWTSAFEAIMALTK